MTFTPVWGTEIAWYLFLAGLGAGAYAFSVFVQHFYPEAVKTRKFARFAAPIVVIVGLVLLMVDARAGFTHPLRFALLLHNPGSVMTWGVVFLAAFIVVSLVAALLEILKKPVWNWLNVVAVALSFCVAGYTGVLLGVLNAFPLWNNGVLPVLFVVSAFSTGAAFVMLGAQIFEPELAEGMVTLKRVHWGIALAEVVLVAALLFVTAYANAVTNATVMNIVAGGFAPLFWIGFIGIGLLFPIVTEGFELFGKRTLRAPMVGGGYAEVQVSGAVGSRVLAIVTEAAVLVGGFLLRYIVVLAALPVAFVG